MSEQEVLKPEELKPKHSTQIISLIVGALLTILGLCGILFSGFAGLHMGPLHSIFILAAGCILFYTGWKNNSHHAFLACLCFTIFFGLHAIAGFVFGHPGVPSVGHAAPDSLMLTIIPGFHELGKHDHVLNTILSLVLLGGTIDWWRRHSTKGHRTEAVRQSFNKLVHH